MSSKDAELFSGSAPGRGPSVRLPSLPQRPEIIERITSEAILDPVVEPYRSRAQFTFFCGADPKELAGYEGQLELVGRCLEWFVFDYIIPELTATPAQHWLLLHQNTLSKQLATDARNCLRYILSLFEVADVAPGHGFLAIDLLRPGKTYTVSEHIVTREIQPGQLLLGRLFPHRKVYILSGMAALMDSHAADKIKQLVDVGQLDPDFIVESLDGIELENLFGRSLHDVAQTKNLAQLHQRLRCYLEITSAPIDFLELISRLEFTDDPFELAQQLTEQIPIHYHHEAELILAFLTAIWNQTHKP